MLIRRKKKATDGNVASKLLFVFKQASLWVLCKQLINSPVNLPAL